MGDQKDAFHIQVCVSFLSTTKKPLREYKVKGRRRRRRRGGGEDVVILFSPWLLSVHQPSGGSKPSL